jgi:ECF transporter S component (folate family)
MRKITTRQLTFAALFAALAVLLSVHPFTFYIVPSVRITFREVPIYLCSFTLGPVFGGLCSFIADTCGTFISNSGNAWNPLFALNAVLIGVLPGLFYRLLIPHMKRLWATSISIVATNLLVSVFLTPIWLCILGFNGGLSYWALLLSRLPLVAVMTVIQIIFVMLLAPLAKRGIEGGTSK